MSPNAVIILLAVASHSVEGIHQAVHPKFGISGDVQNWATLIQNYILQLASDGIKRDVTQSLFDTATYVLEKKDGNEVVRQVSERLGDYFSVKKQAAQDLADKVRDLHDSWLLRNRSVADKLTQLGTDVFRDSDIPSRLPQDLEFSAYFKQPVSFNHSTVKISDEVPRDDYLVINTVNFTNGLEELFKENAKKDRFLRWQYFGSYAGLVRLYPGREWGTNFAGFYNDYDPRVRPWYIAATSGPKDVVIILDCSKSMDGEKFRITKSIAKAVINTLTRQDYVNVVCARASHWDEVGKWHHFRTQVLSCQANRMVPATNAHRKDLIEKIYALEAGGTSELEKGFEMAFDLLNGKARTGCQSILVFVTDGKDTDGENVRCGPGYYTRSGYVPGPICKYNWTKVWDTVKNENQQMTPKARIFSYLTKEDGEIFPGKLACEHRGSMKRIDSGENLISKMSNYFNFLSSNAMNTKGLWTSPYLDAWGLGLLVSYVIPVVSNITGNTIGVVGVDATIEDLENVLKRYQWGSVYSFLINKEGETIFHPFLKPSTNLLDDPIFIPISQLEQDKEGHPTEFSKVLSEMVQGETGHLRIENGRRGSPKGDFRAGIKYEIMPSTYYYGALNDSEYSFAFSLADTDQEFRRSQEPVDKTRFHAPVNKSYFNLLIEYNSTVARREVPGAFEYLEVKYNEPKYPGLRVTYLHSSIFLAPKCYCDPNKYFYNDDLAQKTVDAHLWMNSVDEEMPGCENMENGKYEKGLRADVLITQPIEAHWRNRSFDSLNEVKWTYVGMRTGVFRTYPGHRSTRTYDPSQRPWFFRAKSTPDKTSISTPYMDAAGVGKIVTISQAVFEGMTPRTTENCQNYSKTGPWPGGCVCDSDSDCIVGRCYLSKAPGHNRERRRCATERVEAITCLDILYNDFHKNTMAIMQASDGIKSCGMKYDCPDGEPDCETRCYLFDDRANLIADPDFLNASSLDTSKYKGVTMGKKQGEIMRELIYKHGFFQRKESLDFQGSCSISPYAPKVTLEGTPTNPEEQDNYYKNKGPIPKFSNTYGCIQDVVSFEANSSALGPSHMITGNVSGPCMSGFYYVTELPKTNLFLLVIEDFKEYTETIFFNFNCKIARSVVNSGAYRIINGTCAHQDAAETTLADQGVCPALRDIEIPCTYTTATHTQVSSCVMTLLLVVAVYVIQH
ncbi:voltage-dependent calcium channel subunit alpha-2/delta-2 [Lingula anatina]|uniref:Voltage-dependent calcium channel subunit alpha-2/delta-2 n=2 Tax=Lingula anatina TaxID=7574 RepID=A0A1S3HMX0_LINAN|nr:voltage-dependent calcium channel subunit alpha-2/delta-2 [Lingula anatina]XP_013386855.1 voltage-dependent calcium channel subunit alpha-2/delta-2 [Lingula anatina]XP_013386856.1 voltage-dependent calcium channel subunit alpha-2/delta-2 [Lingula anatina]|eukprot:XP_013386854.1 voltage-dependent calcium channel subunit alpha-2/delta-2 [Lingula anatina]